MKKQTIKFKAVNGQQLERVTPLRDFATGTVNYLQAEFELSDIWNGYTEIVAVWFTDTVKKETPIDDTNVVTIPKEVLEKRGALKVNLSASLIENGDVVKRTTSYPTEALTLTSAVFDNWQEPGIIRVE